MRDLHEKLINSLTPDLDGFVLKGVILNTTQTYFPLSADSECVLKDDKVCMCS